jgi:hypothetical protein
MTVTGTTTHLTPTSRSESYHVSGYVHHIDACLMLLLYQYRSHKSEVDDGKDEKDSRNYVVAPHFCWMCYAD